VWNFKALCLALKPSLDGEGFGRRMDAEGRAMQEQLTRGEIKLYLD